MKSRSLAIAGLAALGLVLGWSHPHVAGAGRGHTMELPYESGAIGASTDVETVYWSNCDAAVGCVEVPLDRDHRFVDIEIADLSGFPVQMVVVTDGDEVVGKYCWYTERPIRLPAGARSLQIHVMSGANCLSNHPSVATRGVVTLSLTTTRTP